MTTEPTLTREEFAAVMADEFMKADKSLTREEALDQAMGAIVAFEWWDCDDASKVKEAPAPYGSEAWEIGATQADAIEFAREQMEHWEG